MEHFRPSSTAHSELHIVTSEPVPDVVGTATIGIAEKSAGYGSAPRTYRASHAAGSATRASAANALALSSTLPPPIATTDSGATAARSAARAATKSIVGLD